MDYNCLVHKYRGWILALMLVLTGCGFNLSQAGSGTATPFIITATLALPTLEPSTPTSLAPLGSPTPASITGVTANQLNVRSAPSTTASALGMISPSANVQILGVDSSGSWYQIVYPQSPDGKGWIASQYVQVQNKDSIPVLAGTATATAVQLTPQVTQPLLTSTPLVLSPTALGPAPQDGDSAQSPAVNLSFSPGGIRSLIYSSDLSAPEGDSHDWIRFTPEGDSVSFKLSCVGNGNPSVALLQDGAAVQNWSGLGCGQEELFSVKALTPYLVELSLTPAGQALEYVHYTITIQTGD